MVVSHVAKAFKLKFSQPVLPSDRVGEAFYQHPPTLDRQPVRGRRLSAVGDEQFTPSVPSSIRHAVRALKARTPAVAKSDAATAPAVFSLNALKAIRSRAARDGG